MSLRIAMFVFNSGNGDLRVHRQASLLAARGHEVRLFCFLEPGLPERESRAGYTIQREDQRPRLTRFFDDRVLAALRKPKPGVPPPPPPETEVALPVDRAPVRPCPPPPPRQLPAASSPAVREHRRYIQTINEIWARRAAQWKPDVCQAHDADALEAAGLCAERCGIPFFYDAHELWSDQPFIADQESVDYWNALERRWIGQARRVFTVNEPLARVLEQRYGLARVTSLHNCQALQPAPRPRKLSERVGGKKVALYQGVYAPDRGLEELVAATRGLTDVCVALRGYGEREPYLRELVRRYELPVLFLEPVPAARIVESAAEADFGVIPFLPSCLNHYLSTPNKLFEYMMAGIPVTGSDLPELQAFVAEAGLGELFDPYSGQDVAAALQRMAGRDLATMGRHARHLAESVYHWEKEGDKLADAYQELIGAIRN